MKSYRIIEPSSEEELEKYYQLRYEILRKPWNQPVTSTRDEWEKISIHMLMLDENGEGVATGRLQLYNNREGQIRSMAVRTDLQGKGLGTEIIRYIEQKANEKKLDYLILDARENAIHFYEKHGYFVISDSYMLFGVIRHFRMKKNL
ncbi:MAG: GNAT family N-acetyltransferase [Bacteroidetes bacterium]|nr:GNAT family N-acetyltransferase [Bacteroidota bacterium]